jgi:FixJ family two-component response regulator
MSGYTENAMLSNEPPALGFHFIGKPFSKSALLRKVREALDATKIKTNDVPKGTRGEEPR